MSCAECERVAAKAASHGVALIERGPWVVHPRAEPGAVPGWWLIAPARHVEQFDQLVLEETASLAPLIALVSAALRAATPTAKIYVAIFAELMPHLHVHVIARPDSLPVEERGPAIFASKLVADAKACEEVAAAVAARLSGTAAK